MPKSVNLCYKPPWSLSIFFHPVLLDKNGLGLIFTEKAENLLASTNQHLPKGDNRSTGEPRGLVG